MHSVTFSCFNHYPFITKVNAIKDHNSNKSLGKKPPTSLLVPSNQFFRDYLLLLAGKVPINVRKLLILTNAPEKKRGGKDTDLQ